jgi:acyl carrier protein
LSTITLERVVELLDELVDLSGITPAVDSRLGLDIAITSQEMLRLTSRLEARFGFRFLPGQVLMVRTLGDLVQLARDRAAARGRP